MAQGFRYGGYVGQLLRINLNNKAISKEPLRENWAREFVGGVGLAARMFYEEVRPKIDPFGPLRSAIGLAVGFSHYLIDRRMRVLRSQTHGRRA